MNFTLNFWNCGRIAALSVALLVSGCGGGGGSDSAGAVAPTGSVYSGPITGFGSVIVNGVRFDTVGSTTVDDDGNEVRLEDLRIGMMVTVGGDANESTGRGSATRLSLSHGTTGLIESIGADSLVLLGQTVNTNASTIYEGVAAFSALQVGDTIEVYGVLQSDNTLLATLIEKKSLPASGLRLIGRMSDLNTTAKTFVVGGLTVNYATATSVVGTLGNGKRVKIRAAATDLVGGVLTASSVKVNEGAAYGESVSANTYLKLKGVAETAPVNGLLKVSGTPVDVSAATFEGGSSTITAGQFIKVKGIWDGSVLKASKVQVGGEDNDRNELYGAISDAQPSSGTPTTVVVHGVTVDVSSAVFSNGKSAADLVVGRYVEIKGHVVDGVLVATRIELKTGSDAAGFDFEDHGVISDFVSTSSFKVNGVTVDASGARFEDGATSASLINGAYVEIKGALNASGVFVATKVEFKTSAPG